MRQTVFKQAAANSHQSCLTLCTPIDGSPPGSHPWDSPGKNPGVDCHFLLQCMKVKCESKVAQSCLTLHDPMDCSLPGSSVHGISQAIVLEWVAIAFSIQQATLAYFPIMDMKIVLFPPKYSKISRIVHIFLFLLGYPWIKLGSFPVFTI